MKNSTTLIIADDHPVFRKGLKDIIRVNPNFQIIAEAENGEVALKLIEEHKPQIAIIDIEMPVMSGFDLVKTLHAKNRSVDIIFLTMYKEEDIFNEAMELGIKGYVLKESAVNDIMDCIQTVASGNYYISPLVSSYLLNRNDKTKTLLNKYPTLVHLTSTEKKILRLIGDNKTSREIAEGLFISYKTVENHRNNIANKLKMHGAHQLLKFALENRGYL